jgi:hypothetical protein
MSRMTCAVFLSLTLTAVRAEGQPPNQPPPNQPTPDFVKEAAAKAAIRRMVERSNEIAQWSAQDRKWQKEAQKRSEERQRVLHWLMLALLVLCGSVMAGAVLFYSVGLALVLLRRGSTAEEASQAATKEGLP